MRVVSSNKKLIKERARQAFKKTAIALDEKNKEIISEPRYWEGFEGRTTHRSSGEVVEGAFRNIVDLSNLFNSQTLQIKGNTATIFWDGKGITPVVGVYFGQRTANDFIPGRPWVQFALDELDLVSVFKSNF